MNKPLQFNPYDQWAMTINPPKPGSYYSVPIYAKVHYRDLDSFLQFLTGPQEYYYIERHEFELLQWYRTKEATFNLYRTDPDSAIEPIVYCVVHRVLRGYDFFDDVANQPKAIYPADLSYNIQELGTPSMLPDEHTTYQQWVNRENTRERFPNPEISRDTTHSRILVGIIDDDIAALNQRFTRKQNGKLVSRFDSHWLQGRIMQEFRNQDSAIIGGLAFTDSQIQSSLNSILGNTAVKTEFSVYRDVKIRLGAVENKHIWSMPRVSAHGTHMADIAAGAFPWSVPSELSERFHNIDSTTSSSLSRAVDLIGVSLSNDAISDTSGTKLDIQILRALRWIIYRAVQHNLTGINLPLVVNISLGFSAGSKDGSDLLAQYLPLELDTYQKLTGNNAKLVLAFGNNHDQGSTAILHSASEIAKQPSDTTNKFNWISWRQPPNDYTPSYLEIRTPDSRRDFEFSLISPDNRTTKFNNALNGVQTIKDKDDNIIGSIFVTTDENSNNPTVTIALTPTASPLELPLPQGLATTLPGAWKIDAISGRGRAILQVQRDDTPAGYQLKGRQSYLEHPNTARFNPQSKSYSAISRPLTNLGTHSALANNKRDVVSCGATYVARREPGKSHPNASWYTSRGGDSSDARAITTISGPTCSAAADESPNFPGTIASGNFSGTLARYSGSSVASARVTRAVILQQLSTGTTNSTSTESITHEDQDRLGETWFSPKGDRLTTGNYH